MTEDDTFEALSRPPTADEIYFGRKSWIYCCQHLAPHMTGWCTVGNSHKTRLAARSGEEARVECQRRGFILYEGN